MTAAYEFYIDDMLLPVTPDKLRIKISNQNKTITLINGDEVNVLKRPGLSQISFSFLLPAVRYPFAVYLTGFQEPQQYLEKLETLKNGLKPFAFKVVRPSFQTSFTVSLEDYEIEEDAEKHGRDVLVTVSLLQYKAIRTKTLTFKDSTTATPAPPPRDQVNKPATASYTVKPGDCLWNIAKKYLGSGSKWQQLYEANKAVIEAAAKKMGRESSSNGRWIYPGTVLTIPGAATAKPPQSGNQATKPPASYQKRYTKAEAVMLAKTMYNESRGIKSKTEIACIGWVVANRVDAGNRKLYGGTIGEVLTKPNQFAYTAGAKTTSDYGYDLVALATDVLDRWSRESSGQTNVGRVLPRDYLWYKGDGRHNWFYRSYQSFLRGDKSAAWNYRLVSPY